MGWVSGERRRGKYLKPKFNSSLCMYIAESCHQTQTRLQNPGIICKKNDHQNWSAVTWQDLNLCTIPVHNHDQSSNVCAVTLEICDDYDHESSNLVHPTI